MKTCSIAGVIVVGIVLSIGGCGNAKSPMAAWNPADPAFVRYPVSDLVMSTDNRFAAAQVNEKMGDRNSNGGRATYIIDLKTGQHRRFDSHIEFLTFSDHRFVRRGFSISTEPLQIIDGLETRSAIGIGAHSGGWRNPRSDELIFATGWNKSGTGFNELSIVSPKTGAIHKVQTEVSESLGFCASTGHFYTEREIEGKRGGDEFDMTGNRIRTLQFPFGVYSSDCNFAVPFDALFHHGPATWGIYGAIHFNRLVEYAWSDDNSSGLHWFQSWNPTQDNLLLIRTLPADNGSGTSDVLDVSEMKIIKSWPWPNNPTEPPAVWSGDGKAIVTVRDRHIVFDQVVQ